MAQSKTVPPPDRTRFIKLSLVIIEELTPLLQDVLQHEISPNEIYNQVSRETSLYQKLRAEQIALIQNAHNDGYNNFDITLLYTLLRNLSCLKVTAPTQGWGRSQMPENGEITLGDDIERIRLIRNTVYGHVTVPSLSKTEFQEHWSNIEDICRRMGTLLGKNYIQSLLIAKMQAIDIEMESRYLQKINDLCNAEKSTRELLQMAVQNKALRVDETVRIEARDPQNNEISKVLTDTSISILNDMKDAITEIASDSELQLLYKSVEEFIRVEKENISTIVFCQFYEDLKHKIKEYAKLKYNRMHIFANFLQFTLKLRTMYGAELQSSQGSLLLELTFSSEKGYDLYMQDLKRGEIAKLIISLLYYPPYLANFNLHAEDLMIDLNDNELTAEKKAVLSPLLKPLLDHPRLTATIDTGYDGLYSVICVSDEEFWALGENKDMKRLNLQGKLMTSIQTQSGYESRDITVTRDGNLVYIDYVNKTVNLVNNKQIQTVITLLGWVPRGVCSTASDDILLTMNSDDRKQLKVVRYFGSTETQTIQFDNEGRPLYSSGSCNETYISENRNLDICVTDQDASAVVVVNQSGNFRFRYTGHPSYTKQSFTPRGITTDSQSHILTADWYNHCIHILDQDGQFLRYIDCGLEFPWGLCVDIRDNLFVAECHTAKVKKIQYL